MPADSRIYDSERLAAYYARTRPPLHETICRKLFAALPAGFEVRAALDVGCGAGASTAVLVSRVGSVSGIDPYEPMLRQARLRVPAAAFIRASVADLPVRPGSMDLVTAAGSLNYTDPARSLAQVGRVLSPAGYLAVYDFATGRVLPGDATTEAGFAQFERVFPWPGGYALDIENLPLAANGLSRVHLERFVIEQFMSQADYVAYMLGETNVEAAVSRGLREQDARRTCEEIFGPFFAGGPRRVGFDGVLMIAGKRGDDLCEDPSSPSPSIPR